MITTKAATVTVTVPLATWTPSSSWMDLEGTARGQQTENLFMSNIMILAALAKYINTGAAASGRVAATTMVPVPKVTPARGFEAYGKQAADSDSEFKFKLKQHHLDAASASDSHTATDCLRVKTVVRCPMNLDSDHDGGRAEPELRLPVELGNGVTGPGEGERGRGRVIVGDYQVVDG
jgi:hypothetical protein